MGRGDEEEEETSHEPFAEARNVNTAQVEFASFTSTVKTSTFTLPNSDLRFQDASHSLNGHFCEEYPPSFLPRIGSRLLSA